MVLDTYAKILIAVVGHDRDYLVSIAEGGDQLARVPSSSTVLHNRYFISNAFWIARHVDTFDSNEDFTPVGVWHGLIICG